MANKIKMNKKGISDLFILLILIFGLIIVSVFSTKFLMLFQSAAANVTKISNNTEATTAISSMVHTSQQFDFIVLAGFICLFLVVLILAIALPTNPAFVVVFILFGMVGVVFSVILSNVYEAVANTSQFGPVVSSYYPITSFIMGSLPLIFSVLIAVLIIVTYMRSQSPV